VNAELYRFTYEKRHLGMRQSGAVTIDGDARIFNGARTGEGDTAIITSGAVIDAILAAYLKTHGHAGRVKPILQPDPEQLCPIDGAWACGELTNARNEVTQVRQLGARAQLLGWHAVAEVDGDTGRVTRERDFHTIVAAEELGLDWRSSALVRSGWNGNIAYKVWFSEPWPDPQIPHLDPPLPRPTVDTPASVRAWFHREVAAGRIVVQLPAAPLPDPAARRQLREKAGVSRPKVAELLGISRELVRQWELGEKEPQEPQRAAYAELLGQWSAAQKPEPQPQPENSEPEPEAVVPPSDPQRHPGTAPGRGPVPGVSYRQTRAEAYARQRERKAQAHGGG
jgi:DNA-binding XRE family transcriptional regulator